MMAFLFAMVHCGIRKYQSGVKVVRPFNKKIAQSVYCHCITTYRYGYTNIDDKYVYMDLLTIV